MCQNHANDRDSIIAAVKDVLSTYVKESATRGYFVITGDGDDWDLIPDQIADKLNAN